MTQFASLTPETLAEVARTLRAAGPAAVSRRPIRNADELHAYVLREYDINVPRTAVCEGHCAPFDALRDAYFGTVDDAIWVGPRTGGKTLQFALLDHLLMDKDAVSIANVGAVEAQAKKCYEYFRGFCGRQQFRDRVQGQSLMSSTRFWNGATIEILPATINRVNSPHPNRAHWDEIELTSWRVIQEGLSMPTRIRTPDGRERPPATIYTSSRKKAHGPMERLLRESDERGFRVYKWCWAEIVETCPPERHQNGVGCATCPLAPACLEPWQDPQSGEMRFPDGPGRAARANGWMRLEDVFGKFTGMDRSVFNAQWGSLKPEGEGLVFPMFDRARHVVDWKWVPQWPVVAGIDFGWTNPSCAIYFQLTPNDEIVVFAEDYKSRRTADELATSMKRESWFDATEWRVADAANRGDRETLKNNGVENEPCDKSATKEGTPSIVAGLNLIRYLLSPEGRGRPLLFFDRSCVNTIREVEEAHYPDPKEDRNLDEDAVDNDDHALDGMRYALRKMYEGTLYV